MAAAPTYSSPGTGGSNDSGGWFDSESSAGAASRGRAPGSFPGWSDLSGVNRRTVGEIRPRAFLRRLSTIRFTFAIVLLGLLCTLYVGHVHATRNLLAELQQQRRENLRLHLEQNRLKGTFDQMVGPSVIYARAQELGLIEDPALGPSIREGG